MIDLIVVLGHNDLMVILIFKSLNLRIHEFQAKTTQLLLSLQSEHRNENRKKWKENRGKNVGCTYKITCTWAVNKHRTLKMVSNK